MATSINYDDERFAQVESDKQEALTEVENAYGGMKEQADSFYQAQIDASKEYATQQQQNQQAQTDFAIEQINQQKEQAEKDYKKEQSGAYVDWQKQSNQYGANAEQMAASGMQGTGFSESSQVSMFNTYQNRVATARQTYSQAVLNYDNAIKDAQLQNNAALADIAFNSLQQQLQLALEQFQYGNQLVLDLLNQKQQITDRFHNQWLDVEAQINQENALAEEIRQYNESLAYQREQDAIKQAQWEKEYALSQQQLAEEKRQFDEELALAKKKSSSGGSSGGSGGSSSPNTSINKSSGSGQPTLTNVRQGALSLEGKQAYKSTQSVTTNNSKKTTNSSKKTSTTDVVKLAERKPGETMSEYVMRMKALGLM